MTSIYVDVDAEANADAGKAFCELAAPAKSFAQFYHRAITAAGVVRMLATVGVGLIAQSLLLAMAFGALSTFFYPTSSRVRRRR